MCDLCDAYPKQAFGNFFLIICRSCGVPMLVLRDHRSEITKEEFAQFVRLLSCKFPGYTPRGIGTRSIPDHWHEHLCFPGHDCPI